MMLHCVSDCCPVGCAMRVVALQSLDDRSLFCYCDSCGCVFRSPAEAQFEAGLNEIAEPAEFAPNGVASPSKEQLDQVGWGSSIIETFEDDDMIATVNEQIVMQRRAVNEFPR